MFRDISRQTRERVEIERREIVCEREGESLCCERGKEREERERESVERGKRDSVCVRESVWEKEREREREGERASFNNNNKLSLSLKSWIHILPNNSISYYFLSFILFNRENVCRSLFFEIENFFPFEIQIRKITGQKSSVMCILYP